MSVTNHTQKFYAIQRGKHSQGAASSYSDLVKKKKDFHRLNFANNISSHTHERSIFIFFPVNYSNIFNQHHIKHEYSSSVIKMNLIFMTLSNFKRIFLLQLKKGYLCHIYMNIDVDMDLDMDLDILFLSALLKIAIKIT